MEHEVERAVRARGLEGIALRVVDHGRAEALDEGHVRGRADADDAGTEGARELHGAEAHSSGRAEDEHPGARAVVEVREVDEGLRRRRAGDAEACGLVERHGIRQERELVRADDGLVRVAAELLSREVRRPHDARADREAGDPRPRLGDLTGEVDPDDQRTARADEAMGEAKRAAFAHLPVDRIDADRANAHPDVGWAEGPRRHLDEGERRGGRLGRGYEHRGWPRNLPSGTVLVALRTDRHAWTSDGLAPAPTKARDRAKSPAENRAMRTLRAPWCFLAVAALGGCSRSSAEGAPPASGVPSTTGAPPLVPKTPTTQLPEATLRGAYAGASEALDRHETFAKQLEAATARAGAPQLVENGAGESTSYWWAWGPRVTGPCLQLSLSPRSTSIGPTDPSKCGM